MADLGNHQKSFEDMGLAENFATNTKFIAQIPMQTIFPDLVGDVRLNIASFRLPEIVMGMTEVKFLSKATATPTRILTPESHEITFEYMLSSNYHQYIILYRWLQRIATEMQNQNTNFVSTGDPTKYRLPVTIFFLSEFKRPVLSFTMHNAWLQRMGEIMFDYQMVTDEAIKHSFTLRYDYFSFQTLANVNGADGRDQVVLSSTGG